MRPLIEPWATQKGMVTETTGQGVAIALEIPEGEEKDGVVRSLVDDLKAVAAVLDALPPKTAQSGVQEESDETTA